MLLLKLTVAPASLAQAVEDAGLPGLRLSTQDGAEVTFGGSRLTFTKAEEGLQAATLVIRDDPQAAFTLRLLAPLFQRHRGDLHLVLSWEGDVEPRELRIIEGKAVSTTGGPGQRPGAPGAAEEKEIRRLLEEGRRHWEEYQRLKAEAGKGDAP